MTPPNDSNDAYAVALRECAAVLRSLFSQATLISRDSQTGMPVVIAVRASPKARRRKAGVRRTTTAAPIAAVAMITFAAVRAASSLTSNRRTQHVATSTEHRTEYAGRSTHSARSTHVTVTSGLP